VSIHQASLQSSEDRAEILRLNRDFTRESGVTVEANHSEGLEQLLLTHPTLFAFIARNEAGDAIGYALCQYTISSFAPGRVANVHDLYVEPNSRRQGVAHELLAHFERAARENQCKRLSLEVNYGNVQAQKLYRELGFSDGSDDRNGDATWFWIKPLP